MSLDAQTLRTTWTGDDWEVYAKQLLVTRYGVRFQPVFDRDRGDWGIEGYVSDEGSVFQCYAAEEPRDADDLYTKQRGKITTDLKKLIKNRAAIANVVGCPIRLWVLLVPDCDTKRLLTHAGTKQGEVRAAEFDEIAEGFAVHVLTHREFSTEKVQIHTNQLVLPSPADELDYYFGDVPLLNKLSEKAAILSADPADQEALVDDFVAHYVRGRSLLGQIQESYLQVWTSLDQVIAASERHLQTSTRVATETEKPGSIGHLYSELEGRLLRAAPSLSEVQAMTIAWFVIADWLIRCPLTPIASP